MSKQPEQEYVVVAQGNLSRHNRELVLDFLGHLGLDTSVMTARRYLQLLQRGVYPGDVHTTEVVHSDPPASHPDPADLIKPFETICSRDDYVVYEHFREFRERFKPDVHRRTMGDAFTGCLDVFRGSKGQRRRQDVKPGQQLRELATRTSTAPTLRALPNLVIRTRSELGLPPFGRHNQSYRTRSLAQFALQAGSYVDQIPQFGHLPNTKAARFALDLALQLEQQLTS